jgi:hypothetical protein
MEVSMKDIDGNEVGVGDVVRVLEIDHDYLENCETDDEKARHLAMLNNDYHIDEIVDNGTKARVSIEWIGDDGIIIGGLFMLANGFRLVKRTTH